MLLSLGVFVAANFTAALSGAIFMPREWYRALRKPWWQPPDWLFAPAWTVLFIMIALSGWLFWRAAGPGEAMLPLTIYAVQLVFNAAWSALFFGLKRMDLALVDAILMGLAILANILVFWPVSTIAALLLVPYLAWVCFATWLNWTIWRLNPDRNGGRM